MTPDGLAERLLSKIDELIRSGHWDATARVDPRDGHNGPFVELEPAADSPAPAMSVHVLDGDSVTITVGNDSTGEVIGPPDTIVGTVSDVAEALLEGSLHEELVRSRSGRTLRSTLSLSAASGDRVLWKRSSASALSDIGRKTREIRNFPAYPSRA